MLFAPIVPIPMLPEISQDMYHMILAPLCRIEEYSDFYRDVMGWKILDNGSAEGGIVTTEALLKYASELNVDEVIAPDAYDDPRRSMRQLVTFMPFAVGFNVMAVLQAHNWKEFSQIFQVALDCGVSA